MWVLSTHLSPHPRQQSLRWRQLELLGEVIERLARPARDVAVVLGGDFNAPSHAREMRAFARRTDTLLVDAWRQAGDGSAGYTWSPGNPFTRGTEMPSGRLDYVFVAAGAARERVVRARIVCDQSITGVLASDHYGVVAELARSEAAPAGPSWSDEK
jgi:endonuclease/exonuclease/phosphatase family metal-dependent hydrolase